MNAVRPGSDSTVERALVAVHDDPVRGGQPESGAVAHVLGGEERVEHAVADLGGDPGAVVGDLDLGEVAEAARGDRDRPAVVERVDRVVEQIGPDLVQLGAAHGQLGQRRDPGPSRS